MKKLYLVLMSVAALSMATLSCSKEADDPTLQEENNNEEVVVEDPTQGENPTDDPVPEGMVRLTFGVSHEKDAQAPAGVQKEDEDTKTSWDGSTHAWSEGDRIRVFWGTGDEDFRDVTVDNEKNTVSVVAPKTAETFYAVYPAEDYADFVLNYDDGSIDVAIPRNQNGSFSSANKMVAKTTAEALSFAFKNVTHIVKFHFTESAPYDKLEFTSNENATLIVDAFGVSFDSDNNVAIGTSNTAYSSFTGTHSKYVDLVSLSPNSDYYFAVVPGSNFLSGFGVKAHIKGSTDDYDLGAISKAELTTTRGCITNLGDLDPRIHADWFIRTQARGNGDGSSWDNAGDLSLFLSLIKHKTNDNGVNSTWRLKNAKIHFAEGTYNVQEANDGTLSFLGSAWDGAADDKYKVKNITVIDGGYPNTNTGMSLSGKSASDYPTIWRCNEAADSDRIFYANGCHFYDWTFDSITFTSNSTSVNTRGIAFFFNDGTDGKVTFKECYFKNLNSSNTLGGAAVDFNSNSESDFVVSFDSCHFESNTASSANNGYGGAIVIEQGEHTTVNILGCIADNNVVTSDAGQGGFLCQRGGTVNIKGGIISNSQTKSANGGAIYQYAGTLNISAFNDTDSTKFIGNTASGKRGGAILTKSTLSIDKASFRNNSSSNGGALHLEAGADVEINNSTFKRNSATNGGAIRTDGECSLDIPGGCSFDYNTSNGTGGCLNIRSSCSFSMGDEGPSVFASNSAGNGAGGAMYVDAVASATVSNVTFRGNRGANGGAIYSTGACGLTLDNCIFESNTARNTSDGWGEGGAINIKAGATDITIKNSSISNCSAGKGGGVSVSQTSGTTYLPVSIYNTSIISNTAYAGPGGLYSIGKNDLLLVNCTISSNTGTNGGGIYATRYNSNSSYITRMSLVSCTVTNNTASAGCGGVYKDTYGQVVDVYNCIISGNTGTDTNNDVRNERLLYHVTKSVVVGTSYESADRVNNNTPVGSFQWRTSSLSDPSAFIVGTMLSSLSGDVHIVNDVAENPARLCGMSKSELSSLSLSYTPTQTVDKSFYIKDQKGNDRTGTTIMGAYVLDNSSNGVAGKRSFMM